MAYGVQSEGFVIKPLTQINADIVQRLVDSSEVGPNQDYSSKAPLGQIVGANASEISELWELGYAVHTSGDPEGALDVPLDQVLSLTGSERQGAQPSRVKGALLTLDPGAIVPAGSLVSVDTRPDIQFTLDAELSSPTGATGPAQYEGDFTCTQDGPIAVNANTLTVIDSSISGWTAVTNPTAASPGRLTATNVEFRQRWADERARSGSTTVAAIKAALLDTETNPELATVEKVLVLQNKKDRIDVNGLPPHSVEAIVDDGPTPSVDDDLIAQIIWDRGAAGGIETHGTVEAVAIDSEGNEQPVNFSRVTRRSIYIALTVETTNKFPNDGEAKVKTALVTSGNDYDVDDDVIAEFIKSQAFTVAGVRDVTAFAIGLTVSPTEEENIPMGYRERATFDVARVTVTVI
jgi:hypothetical protein